MLSRTKIDLHEARCGRRRLYIVITQNGGFILARKFVSAGHIVLDQKLYMLGFERITKWAEFSEVKLGKVH